LTGCAGPKTASKGALPVANSSAGGANAGDPHRKIIVTPETALVGRVVRVNENARFAVINFPVGTMPANEQRLNVYRSGLKVGEVRVTGPQQEDNTVADILTGNVQTGDELRGD